jgi:hypothetical protein
MKKLLLLHLSEEEEKIFSEIWTLASEDFLEDIGEQMIFQKGSIETEKIIYPER